MARHQLGAKPLSEPMMANCELHPWGHIKVKPEVKQLKTLFMQENAFKDVVSKMDISLQ